jgi:predicted ATP-dependent endonuclease of OLD family
MNSIGFKNFKKFKDFPQLEFGGITFLVGRNNAGKSTFVKAILLIMNYLKEGRLDTLSLDSIKTDDQTVTTFGRLRNRYSDGRAFAIDLKLQDYTIQLECYNDDAEKTFANIHSLFIVDNSNKLTFTFDVSSGRFSSGGLISFEELFFDDNSINEELKSLDEKIKFLKKWLKENSSLGTEKEYIDNLEEQRKLSNRRRNIKAHRPEEPKPMGRFSLAKEIDYHEYDDIRDIVKEYLKEFTALYQKEFDKRQRGQAVSAKFADYQELKRSAPEIEKSLDRFVNKVLGQTSVAYLSSNNLKQSALFFIRDRSNPLSQGIHQFYRMRIADNKNSETYAFLKKWMRLFDIGDDLEITLHAGEAYEVRIFNGKHPVINLADKGSGSVQAMLLILRIAVIIHGKVKDRKGTYIVIEEPELNLHPALQSKIADLLFEVNQEFGVEFIVETHSEYIIRRSQVLVAEKELEVKPNENPFRMYYFLPEGLPYKIGYKEDGSLTRPFGSGFFDEATAKNIELLRIKREKLEDQKS